MDLALNLELVGYRTYQAGTRPTHLKCSKSIQKFGSSFLVISSGNRRPRSSEMPSDTDFLPKPVCKGALDRVLKNVERKLAAA